MKKRYWFCPVRQLLFDYEEMPRPPTRNYFGRAPSFIQDSVEPFVSHADGKIYESKSEYRRTLKNLGYEEIGNESVDLDKYKQEKERRDQEKFDATFEDNFETAWSEHTA